MTLPLLRQHKTTDQRASPSLQHFPQLLINHYSVNGNDFNPNVWANTKRNRWPYLQHRVLEAQAVWVPGSTACEPCTGPETSLWKYRVSSQQEHFMHRLRGFCCSSCFHLKWGLGFSLKEQHILLSCIQQPWLWLVQLSLPGSKLSTLAAGSQKTLLGGGYPAAAPKKTPKSLGGGVKGSGWGNISSSDSARPLRQ